MVELNNTKVFGLSRAMIISGYPMLTDYPVADSIQSLEDYEKNFKRLTKLGSCKPNTGHDSALKGIIVQADIKYPQYFTPQLQRYNWIDIISSMSKMHTLTKNKDITDHCNKYVLDEIIIIINKLIFDYNHTLDKDMQHELFMTIVSNLPMGYELVMGISTNYLQLKTIYNQRKSHKLDDWHLFTNWILDLPYFKELTGVVK